MSIVERIEAGKVDLLELGLFAYLSMKADDAGEVQTSATSLCALCPQVSLRTIQRKLRHLEQLGLIKTPKMSGRSGLYTVLVCRSNVGDSVGDAHAISGEGSSDWHNQACDSGDERDGCVSLSQPAESCLDVARDDGRELRQAPPAAGNPLEELGVGTLPDRHADFVQLAGANPRADDESVGDWAERMMSLSNELNIFFPRQVFARARDAAA